MSTDSWRTENYLRRGVHLQCLAPGSTHSTHCRPSTTPGKANGSAGVERSCRSLGECRNSRDGRTVHTVMVGYRRRRPAIPVPVESGHWVCAAAFQLGAEPFCGFGRCPAFPFPLVMLFKFILADSISSMAIRTPREHRFIADLDRIGLCNIALRFAHASAVLLILGRIRLIPSSLKTGSFRRSTSYGVIPAFFRSR